jgi:hypothetical protein
VGASLRPFLVARDATLWLTTISRERDAHLRLTLAARRRLLTVVPDPPLGRDPLPDVSEPDSA